jgi:hypothetical protein
MGYARIFWIYEDDLRHMKGDEDASAIGRRVLELFERGRFGYDNVNLPSSSPLGSAKQGCPTHQKTASIFGPEIVFRQRAI